MEGSLLQQRVAESSKKTAKGGGHFRHALSHSVKTSPCKTPFFSFILITLNYDAGTWNLIVPFRKKMGFYNETGTLVSKLDLQDFKEGTP